MKCLRLGFVLSLICVGLTPMGAANDQTNEAIDHWNTNAVLAALQSLKAGDIQAVTSEGRSVVTAKTRGGLNVGVYAKSCDPTPTPTGVEAICHGLEAIISFDPGPKVDRVALAERLNHQFALGKFLAEPDGSIRLSRYVVLDGGVGPGNLRAELASLFAIGGMTGQTLWPEAARR